MATSRKWGALAAAVSWTALYLPPAAAIGLGEAEVVSALGRTLDARLPLILDASEDPEAVRLRLLPLSAYEGRGLQLPSLHPDGISLSLESRGGSGHWVRLQSRNAVREPVVELLIEVSYGATRLVRGLTLLFDMPANAPRIQTVAPPVAESAAAATLSPSIVHEATTAGPAATLPPPPATAPATADANEKSGQDRRYGPLAEGETLRSIAARVRPAPHFGMRRVMASLRLANPGVFGAPDRRAPVGIRIAVPDAAAMLALDADTITAQVGGGRAPVTSRGATTVAVEPTPLGTSAEAAQAAVAAPAPMSRVERIELDLSAAPALPSIGRRLVLADTLDPTRLDVALPSPAAAASGGALESAEPGQTALASATGEAESAPAAQAEPITAAVESTRSPGDQGTSSWRGLVMFLILIAAGAVLWYRRRRAGAPPAPAAAAPAAAKPVKVSVPMPSASATPAPPVRLVRSQLELPTVRPVESKLQQRLQRLQEQQRDTLSRQKLALAAAYLDMNDENGARQLLDEVEAADQGPARRA
ncbi:MAG TPA: FimV/HubP family polar landmark protein [Solimonas sp.]